MSYCPTCGKQMDDEAKFCVNCGTPSGSATPAKEQGKHLHCPECRSTRLSPIAESTNNGGMAIGGSVTKRVGVSGYSFNTTHRNYWLCQDCGHKFRNIQNLKEEIAANTKSMKGALVFGIIFAVICLICTYLCSAIRGMALLLAPMTWLLVLVDILFWVTWLITQNNVKKMTAELAYLKANCFN